MNKFKFSSAVQAFIDSTASTELTENQTKFVIEHTRKFKGSMVLVSDKIFIQAVSVLKTGLATIETAKFIADAIAAEIYSETRGDREVKKAAKAENEAVALAETKKDKKAVMTRAWVIAKEAQAKFGGKASQYLSGALKAAWAE